MKLIDYLSFIPKLFNWYFKLNEIKRIQFNYIILLSLVIVVSFYNDKLHRENNTSLINRIDSINNSRAKEQELYTKKLESYSDKFNGLLEMLLSQKKEKIAD